MKSESVKQWHRKGTHIYQQENPGGYRFDIAEVFRDVGAIQAESNAQLIVAAPELLEACKLLLRLHYDTGKASGKGLGISQQAESAIAKAEGDL